MENEYFVPIAYEAGVKQDNFLVHSQGKALLNLFKNNLQLKIDDMIIDLTVNLGFANYFKGQIIPIKKIEKSLFERLKFMLKSDEMSRLDLSNFKSCQDFFHMKIWLSNIAVFTSICAKLDEIFTSFNNYQHITQLVLSNNRIKFLSPLQCLKSCFRTLESIDLTNNEIEIVEEIMYLKQFDLKQLTVTGNPMANNDKLHDILTVIFPSLIYCDIKRKCPIDVPIPTTCRGFSNIFDYLNDDGGEIVKCHNVTEEFKKNFRTQDIVGCSWTRVVMEHDGCFNGKMALKKIFLRFFNDTPCYPCYYHEGKKEDFFYLINNFNALKILVENNLELETDKNEYLTFRLHLNCAKYQKEHINFSEIIPKVILKRQFITKINLRNFQEDSDLQNIIVNLSTENGLNFLILSIVQHPNIDVKNVIDIDLSENEIRNVKSLEDLKMLPYLKSLDLSNNEIETHENLPKNSSIIELSLSNNPLCRNFYEHPYRYVRTLKSMFNNLEYIDNHRINIGFNIVSLKNSYCTSQAFTAVENFMEYFFHNYDNNRKFLRNIYISKTIYRERYGTKLQDIFGQKDIINHLLQQPETEHDLVNTTIDVPLFDDKKIQIIINGIVKLKMNGTEKLFTFVRSFILIRGDRAFGTLSNTFYFHIINEICHFSDILDDRIKNKAFKMKAVSSDELKRAYDNHYTPQEIMDSKILLLKEITQLETRWCQR